MAVGGTAHVAVRVLPKPAFLLEIGLQGFGAACCLHWHGESAMQSGVNGVEDDGWLGPPGPVAAGAGTGLHRPAIAKEENVLRDCVISGHRSVSLSGNEGFGEKEVEELAERAGGRRFLGIVWLAFPAEVEQLVEVGKAALLEGFAPEEAAGPFCIRVFPGLLAYGPRQFFSLIFFYGIF